MGPHYFGHLINRDGPLDPASVEVVGDFFQDGSRQIASPAAVSRQADTVRDKPNRIKLFDDPLVGQHPGETCRPTHARAPKRVLQGGCADQFQRTINAIGEELPGSFVLK